MASARILLTLVVLQLTAAQPLLADPITIEFGGVLTSQFGPPLPPSWPVGTAVSGSFTYDPAAGGPSIFYDYEIPAVASGSIGADPFGTNAALRFVNDGYYPILGVPAIGFGDHVVLTVFEIPSLFQTGGVRHLHACV